MKFKLDETLGDWAGDPLTAQGHDVETVPHQGLEGTSDTRLILICRDEARCLVTLDSEFANPLRYDPAEYRGIVVVRIPARGAQNDIVAAIDSLCDAIAKEAGHGESDSPMSSDINGPIDRGLWIAQPGRVRIYQP